MLLAEPVSGNNAILFSETPVGNQLQRENPVQWYRPRHHQTLWGTAAPLRQHILETAPGPLQAMLRSKLCSEIINRHQESWGGAWLALAWELAARELRVSSQQWESGRVINMPVAWCPSIQSACSSNVASFPLPQVFKESNLPRSTMTKPKLS